MKKEKPDVKKDSIDRHPTKLYYDKEMRRIYNNKKTTKCDK